jgi:hypothetical protein
MFLLLGFVAVDIIFLKGYSLPMKILLLLAACVSPFLALLYILASHTILRDDPARRPSFARTTASRWNRTGHWLTVILLTIVFAALTFFSMALTSIGHY